MTRFILVSLGLTAALFTSQTQGIPTEGLGARDGTELPCDAASFASFLPLEATIENAVSVPEGGSYGEGVTIDAAYPWIPTGLPVLCAVTVRVTTSPSSAFRFGLFLPSADQWKERFLAVGNGGFAGGINWIDMAPGPHFGMASVSTDTGHNSTVGDSSWALDNPERQTDWGWRAMHGTVTLGKALTEAYYSRAIRYSYYRGCSTGGRQGLREIMHSPTSFDGVVVGAPAWWTTRIHNFITRTGMLNLPASASSYISPTLFPLIASHVLSQCDALDGVTDSIISAPSLCTPDFTALLCPVIPTTSCLTASQIATANAIYAAYTPENDPLTQYYPGFLPSSEVGWSTLLGGPSDPSPLGTAYQRGFLLSNLSWPWQDYNDTLIPLSDALNPGAANADNVTALASYAARGGKLLLYHGLADAVVPPGGSTLLHSRVIDEAFAGDAAAVHEWFVLMMIPGMEHCRGCAEGTAAPWNLGGATQAAAMGVGEWSVPGYRDAEHDVLLGMVRWVEEGKRVEGVVATAWEERWNASSGVKRQRVVCAWPGEARWNGVGREEEAGSWSCG